MSAQERRSATPGARLPAVGNGVNTGPAAPVSGETPALVLFAHGARDPAWGEPFQRLRAEAQMRWPTRRIELAFLELMTPSLETVLDALQAEGVRAVHVVPLFLAPGSHTRRDLPALLQAARERWPHLQLTTTGSLMEQPPFRQAMLDAVAAPATVPAAASPTPAPR